MVTVLSVTRGENEKGDAKMRHRDRTPDLQSSEWFFVQKSVNIAITNSANLSN